MEVSTVINTMPSAPIDTNIVNDTTTTIDTNTQTETDIVNDTKTTEATEPPCYEKCMELDIVTQYDNMLSQYHQNLRQFKERILQHIDVELTKDATYLKMKQDKDALMREYDQIDALKIAITQEQRLSLLTDINKKLANIDKSLIEYATKYNSLCRTVINNIDNQLKPLSIAPLNTMSDNCVIIDVDNPEYKKEHEACMKILEPYIKSKIMIGDLHIGYIFRPTNTREDNNMRSELCAVIKHGAPKLGNYLIMGNHINALFTIFSYLGFTTSILKCGSYILTNDPMNILRYYYKDENLIRKYTLDPRWPHDVANFSE